MEATDIPPMVRFEPGWTARDIGRRRRLAPGVEVAHWRSLHVSGDIAWLAECPDPAANLRRMGEFGRLPRHLGLPLTRVLEYRADGSLAHGVEHPQGMQLLARFIRDTSRPMSREERVACLVQVAQALDALHGSGVVHRNLDVSAVLWDGEFAMLLDSGWPDAIELGADPRTALHLAPERRAGADADARSDQYLLAGLWLTMGGGNRVSPQDALRQRPAREQPALARAMARDPAHRFDSCGAFAERLRRDLGLDSPAPAEATRMGRHWWARVHPPPAPVPPPMTLAHYRDWVRPLGRPTDSQIDAYVDYLSSKHSWYKHLPPVRPGAVFTLFLTRLAGMVQGDDGRSTAWREIEPGDSMFHYSMMPTAEYRRRFGHLGYGSEAAPEFSLRDSRESVNFGAEPRVFATTEGPRALPPEIVRAGSVEVTAVIHARSAQRWVWEWAMERGALEGLSAQAWPQRSGGAPSLEQILHAVKYGGDKDIAAFIAVERSFQKADLRAAAQRVVTLCFD